ncbi:MAG TPA: MFS transporter [Acidimicrobiales bacterium]|nr:MFS transporter [Acidimicrobiales bacterium]
MTDIQQKRDPIGHPTSADGSGPPAGPGSPPASAVPGTRIHYGATFAVLAVAALAFSLLQSMIIPAIPHLEHALHTSATGATWLLTAYLLSAAIATPILGRVGDMVGKEKMLVVVLVALSLGTLLSALATSLPVMLIGRAIQGTGGAVFPLAFGIIRDEFPRQKVSTAVGIMSAILGIGAGGGIILAGPIVEHLSYHWLFWIPLVLTLLATVSTFAFVPESPVRAPGKINWLGALFMSAWLVTGLVAVSEGPTWGWGNSTVLGLFVVTIALTLLWIWVEVRSDSPVVDMKMMRIPAVWSTNLAALLFGFGMFAMFITVPQFVQTPVHQGYGFGASITQSGLFLLPFAIAMLLVAPLTGRLAIAFGSKPILVAGSIFAASSYGLLALAHSQPWNIYVASGLLGIGIALGYASMSNLIIEAVPPHQTGVATGMNTNIRNIGAALGSGIATSIIVSSLLKSGFPREHGYTASFGVSGLSLVIAALAALKIPNRPHSSVVESLSHPGLTGEAEVFVGAIGYTPEAGLRDTATSDAAP